MGPQPPGAARQYPGQTNGRQRGHRPGGSGWVRVGSRSNNRPRRRAERAKGPQRAHRARRNHRGPIGRRAAAEKGRADLLAGGPPFFTGSADPCRRSWAADATPGTKHGGIKAQNGSWRSGGADGAEPESDLLLDLLFC